MERKLAAILYADVAGYSQLTGIDEEGTHRTLKVHLRALTETIEGHDGRICHFAGDAALAEFGSVVTALKCAVAAQRHLAEHNKNLPENRRLEFRIGVNLGDVIVDGNEIYGNGVNVAARLESLAEPGGICISGRVFEQVERNVDVGFVFLGKRNVKNIDRPVNIYKVLLEPGYATQVIGEAKPRTRRPRMRATLAATCAVVVVVVAVITLLDRWGANPDTVSAENTIVPLRDRPSIVVLPFENMSKGRDHEYFADGISEDLITDLSAVSSLFVIARDTAFDYKGRAVDAQEIGRELGVHYVLRGSVRRAGEDVRINARLIDVQSGGNVWADRYDGTIEDVFELQDSVAQKIISALAVKLTSVEDTQRIKRETSSVEAYDLFLRGWAHYNRSTPEDLGRAIAYLEKAIDRDPEYDRAYAALAAVYWTIWDYEWAKSFDLTLGEAASRARHYLSKASRTPSPLTYFVSSQLLIAQSLHDDAIAEAERALALDPNASISALAMGIALAYAGEPAQAEPYLQDAVRKDPHAIGPLFWLAFVQFNQDRYQESIDTLNRLIDLQPRNDWAYLLVAAAFGHVGRIEDAEAAVTTFDELGTGRRDWKSHRLPFVHYWAFKNSRDFERLRLGLQAAGVPSKLNRYKRSEELQKGRPSPAGNR